MEVTKPKHTHKDTIETTIHCFNIRRKYIYEIRDGEIISERIVEPCD